MIVLLRRWRNSLNAVLILTKRFVQNLALFRYLIHIMNTAVVSLKRQLRKDMASRLEKLTSAELAKQCMSSNLET